MADKPVIRNRGEGSPIWMMGGLYEVKVAGEESGGTVTVMEMTIPEGAGPPLHTHAGGEIAYIIDGSAQFSVDGEVKEASAGSTVYFPKGTVETVAPVGPQPLRILLIYTPGGMDKFFAEAGEPASRRQLPPQPDSPPDVERLAQLGARYGMELRAPS